MENKMRTYDAPGLNMDDLAKTMDKWFKSQGFETQKIKQSGGRYLLQAKKENAMRFIFGTQSALSVALEQEKNELSVQVGIMDWADKAVAGGIGLLVFWPTLLTAAYGLWDQGKMPDKIFKLIEDYISTKTAVLAA